MQMDVDKKQYEKLEDTIEYIYGSAEVIGLFMARIMQLPIKPYEYARMQGRAMQWINFLRDIDEDNHLGRSYFPKNTLKKFGLKDLNKETVHANPVNFKKFMNEQLNLYEQWQSQADKGFSYIPKRLRIPLQTATDMYNWTAKEIRKDPFIIYQKKIKPKKHRIIKTAAKNSVV
jgi:phytoene synthase